MSETAVPAKKNVWAWVRPTVLRVIIGAVVAAALVGVLAITAGDFGKAHLQAVLTILVIITFALLSWYDADVSSKRSNTFALVSVVVSLYLLIAGLFKIWTWNPAPNSHYDGDYYSISDVIGNFFEWTWLVIIARVALLHSHLLLIIHKKYNTKVLRIVAVATLVLIAVFGIMLSLPTIDEQGYFNETYWRLLGAVGILDVLGTVLIPLSYALFAPKPPKTFYQQYNPNLQQPQYVAPATVQQQPVATEQPLPPAQFTPVITLTSQPDAESKIPTAPAGIPGAPIFDKPPVPSRALAWPRYADGTPLPVSADGTPDFTYVERY